MAFVDAHHQDLMQEINLLPALVPQALPDADIETRMSLLQRQMKIGDACTFRLIAKNVVSLLPASQEDLKDQTMTELENLIRYDPRTLRWPTWLAPHPGGILVFCWNDDLGCIDTFYMSTACGWRTCCGSSPPNRPKAAFTPGDSPVF